MQSLLRAYMGALAQAYDSIWSAGLRFLVAPDHMAVIPQLHDSVLFQLTHSVAQRSAIRHWQLFLVLMVSKSAN